MQTLTEIKLLQARVAAGNVFWLDPDNLPVKVDSVKMKGLSGEPVAMLASGRAVLLSPDQDNSRFVTMVPLDLDIREQVTNALEVNGDEKPPLADTAASIAQDPVIKVPYSPSQRAALLDSQMYGHSYGMEAGERQHVRHWLDNNGYRSKTIQSLALDDQNEVHLVTFVPI